MSNRPEIAITRSARRHGMAFRSGRVIRLVATKGRLVNADAAAASVTEWESCACRMSACLAARTTLASAWIEAGAPAGRHDGHSTFCRASARAHLRSGDEPLLYTSPGEFPRKKPGLALASAPLAAGSDMQNSHSGPVRVGKANRERRGRRDPRAPRRWSADRAVEG